MDHSRLVPIDENRNDMASFPAGGFVDNDVSREILRLIPSFILISLLDALQPNAVFLPMLQYIRPALPKPIPEWTIGTESEAAVGCPPHGGIDHRNSLLRSMDAWNLKMEKVLYWE